MTISEYRQEGGGRAVEDPPLDAAWGIAQEGGNRGQEQEWASAEAPVRGSGIWKAAPSPQDT